MVACPWTLRRSSELLEDPATDARQVDRTQMGVQRSIGRTNWPHHLHFEVKDHAYLSDSSTSDDLGNWGYTPANLLPDRDGFHDPVLNFATPTDLKPPLSITTTSQVNLRVGPGRLAENGGEYRTISAVPSGAQFLAVRYAPGTLTANVKCATGCMKSPSRRPDSRIPRRTFLARILHSYLTAGSVPARHIKWPAAQSGRKRQPDHRRPGNNHLHRFRKWLHAQWFSHAEHLEWQPDDCSEHD
jgi:hypothetical protein